ncbi:MAG: UMP kinase [Candidatus Micrarchaeia archaeon]
MVKNSVVISVGGSLINPDKPDVEYIKKLASLLKKLHKKYSLGIVVGGGKPARDYAKAMREISGNESLADRVAILSTFQNAHLVAAALGEVAFFTQSRSFEFNIPEDKIVLMGGTIPGITTDADAALLAEKMSAVRLVNLSNVDGIYDKDPKEKGARKIATLSFEDMLKMASSSDKRSAGEHFIFDLVACKLIARSRIETHFVHGKNLADVENAINGKKHGGSVVK